jgi:hypothetical protein
LSCQITAAVRIVLDRRPNRHQGRRHLLALRGGRLQLHHGRLVGHRLDRDHRGPQRMEALPVDQVDRDLARVVDRDGEATRSGGPVPGHVGHRPARHGHLRGLEILVGPKLHRHPRSHQERERPGEGRKLLDGPAGVRRRRYRDHKRLECRLRHHLDGILAGAGVAAANPKLERLADIAAGRQKQPPVHAGHLGGWLTGDLEHAPPRVVAGQPQDPLGEPGQLAGDLRLHHEFLAAADPDRVGHHRDLHEAGLGQIPPGGIDPLEHERKLIRRPGCERPPEPRHGDRGGRGLRQPGIPRPGPATRRLDLGRRCRDEVRQHLLAHAPRRLLRGGRLGRPGAGEGLGRHERLREVEAAGPLEPVGQPPPVGAGGHQPGREPGSHRDRQADRRRGEPAPRGVVEKQKSVQVGCQQHEHAMHRDRHEQAAEQPRGQQPPAEAG